jgi:regulatory protein
VSSFEIAYNKALKILSRRPYFKKELEKKLFDKGFEKEDIEKVSLKLEEFKFLNDNKTIQSFVKELVSKHNGINLIKKKLLNKNVDLKLLEENINKNDLENKQKESVKYLLQKKKFNLNSKKDKARALRFLQSRGFDYSTIYSILKECEEF